MVFSSPIFLFWYLPLVLFFYYLASKPYRNYVLLFFSFLFYAWGEGEMMAVMITSVVINYLFGLWVDSTSGSKAKKGIIVLFVVANIGLLMYYKYANFFADNYNFAASALGFSSVTWEKVILPLGISFFTFHGMSYVIDIYRKEINVQKNPFSLALYISFFPQLIAGPIVRYKDIGAQLENREESVELFVSGIKRFIIGLAKKVIIANHVGRVAEMIFQTPVNDLGPDLAWLGLITVSIQIYFDFSGYSDMAIGLARMFGFKFSENFIYPLSSKSMREFWTRWHISLSSWFRDYVFIPLGGSKKSFLRTQFNLWMIFLLMGFWHGAEWVFIAFGVWHGIFIVIERAGLERLMGKLPFAFKNLYVWIIYMGGNIIFSSPSMGYAKDFTLKLFSGTPKLFQHDVSILVNRELWLIIALGLILNYPVQNKIIPILKKFVNETKGSLYSLSRIGMLLGYMLLLIIVSGELAGSTYNPFIYFRF